jgi:CRISPR-associated protein Cmr5
MTTTQVRPTTDQRRAAHAWIRIEAMVKDFSEKQANEYARQAKQLPTRAITSGLGQALSFLLAKAKVGTKDEKPHFKRLHDDLTHWVIHERPLSAAKAKTSLLESLIHGDSMFLRTATEEAIAYLQWLNRFAEAKGLKTDSEGD